jgi:PhnB protein
MENHVLQPIPYLAFDGNCAAALDFYAALFGGKIVSKMTFGEMPAEMPMPDEAKSRVVNEMLELPGGAMLYGGDTPPGMTFTPMAGLCLTLNFPTVEEAEKSFNGLADGGRITMPFEHTFWAEKFGMVTDKFGIHWAVNGNLAAQV